MVQNWISTAAGRLLLYTRRNVPSWSLEAPVNEARLLRWIKLWRYCYGTGISLTWDPRLATVKRTRPSPYRIKIVSLLVPSYEMSSLVCHIYLWTYKAVTQHPDVYQTQHHNLSNWNAKLAISPCYEQQFCCVQDILYIEMAKLYSFDNFCNLVYCYLKTNLNDYLIVSTNGFT